MNTNTLSSGSGFAMSLAAGVSDQPVIATLCEVSGTKPLRLAGNVLDQGLKRQPESRRCLLPFATHFSLANCAERLNGLKGTHATPARPRKGVGVGIRAKRR